MTTGEAKALSREFATVRANELPDFAGAFLVGSICRRQEDEVFPYTSDADVRFALTGAAPDPFLEVDGDCRAQAVQYEGLDVETECCSIKTFLDHPGVLGNAQLAPAFRTNNVLLDPTGALSVAGRAVRDCYCQEKWVRARCSDQEEFCLWGLDRAARWDSPLPGFADELLARVGWLLWPGLAGAAGIPCVADLGGPTSRLALTNCRHVLDEYGMLDLYAKLLGILGGSSATKQQVTEFLQETGRAFDLAVRYIRTRFWGGFFFQEYLREKILGGVQELVSEGFHQEAMLYLTVMRSLAQNALENDAPPAVRADLREGQRPLLCALGIESGADISCKAEALRHLLPAIMAATEEIIPRNPKVEHG